MRSNSLTFSTSSLARNQTLIRYMTIVAWCAIIGGAALRLTDLPTRVYYHDEGYTQLRVAGHTAAEMMQAFYDGRPTSPAELRRYLDVDATSSAANLVSSLAREDAQHPPLFYLAELGFVKAFGNALVVWRLFPAIIGILAIAAAFAVARELFSDARAGLLAAAVFAVSPVERLYSDQAREYSLFVLMVLLATLAIVRAMRANTLRSWALYALACTAGLYANPIMAYTVAGHGIFALGVAWKARRSRLGAFAAASAVALLAYGPWLYELIVHRSDIAETNVWSATHWPLQRLAAKWAFNLGSTFFDLEYLDLRWSAALAAVAIVAAIAIVRTFRSADAEARWCLGAGILVPALLLAVPDVLLSQHRSATARYGLPVLAMLAVAVAPGLVGRPFSATLILAAGLFSSTFGSFHPSWWDNDMNADDARIGAIISSVPRAQLASSLAPPEFVSFARQLSDDVRVSLSPNLSAVQFSPRDPLFVLRPTADELYALHERTGLTFVSVPFPRTLTAHDMGTSIAKEGAAETTSADLYRAVDSIPPSH
jgi:uncharacterized membrane protein